MTAIGERQIKGFGIVARGKFSSAEDGKWPARHIMIFFEKIYMFVRNRWLGKEGKGRPER